MKRRINSKSNLYAFLKSCGILEKGTQDQIQKVKKEYWKEYKRKWRRSKREAEKDITISFTQDEMDRISDEAKRHKLSRVKFIKQSCFAYINKTFVVPDLKEVKKISQLLSMSYSSIQGLIEDGKVEYKSGKTILEFIFKMERELLPILHNPNSLEIYIKEHVLKNEMNKNSLIEFINSI
jgi:hypothetical protein